MRRDHIFELLLAISGTGAGVLLMAAPPYQEKHFGHDLPTWAWDGCVYGGAATVVISLVAAMAMAGWPCLKTCQCCLSLATTIRKRRKISIAVTGLTALLIGILFAFQ
jgi:hypothetical protein